MTDTAPTLPDDSWWREFIAADPPRTAKLGTTRRDGSPIVAPVWVAWDSDALVFNTSATALKGRALQRDPRVCLTFDDERPPFAFVIVEGVAELRTDVDEVAHWATVIGGRYMGADRAEEYGARNGIPGELLVRVRPRRVHAGRGVAD